MNIPKYYVVEVTNDVIKPYNNKAYYIGDKAMVWEDSKIGCYWTANTNDAILLESAKKLFEFVGEEV